MAEKPVTKAYYNTKPLMNKDFRWWNYSAKDMYQSVTAVVNQLQVQQQQMRAMRQVWARLYNDRTMMNYMTTSGFAPRPALRVATPTPGYNVVKSAIDTLAAKITQQKVRPLFLTDGGDWNLQQRAKQLSQYVEGVFYLSQFYRLSELAFKHAAIFDTGAIKIFIEDDQIRCETVLINDILVDYIEAAAGAVKQMHQVKYVSRDVVLGLYPEHQQDILAANAELPAGANTTSDIIRVVMSWRLPSPAGAGRYCVSISGCTLFEEVYEKDYFPFVFLKITEPPIGFYGISLADEIMPLQIAIDKTLRGIQRAIDTVARPRVYIEKTANIAVAQINDQVGSIIKFTGTPPVFQTPVGMNPESYNHLKWLIQSAYELVGVSQLSAQGKKPAGLDAAVALREYSDLETERFANVSLQWERFHLDAVPIIIDLSKDLYAQDKNYGIDFVKKIKWKDVHLEKEAFQLKTWPTSLLPRTPAGRLAKIQELVQAGFIAKDDAVQLLDVPDLQEYESLEGASTNLINRTLSNMVSYGRYMPPEPEQNLDKAVLLAQKYYLRATLDEAPEKNREMVLRYIEDCKRLKAQGVPDPNLLQEMQSPPIATPEPAPTSELIPIQPDAQQIANQQPLPML